VIADHPPPLPSPPTHSLTFSPWSHFPFFSSAVSLAVSASLLWPFICIPGGTRRRPRRRADKGHGRSPRGSTHTRHVPPPPPPLSRNPHKASKHRHARACTRTASLSKSAHVFSLRERRDADPAAPSGPGSFCPIGLCWSRAGLLCEGHRGAGSG